MEPEDRPAIPLAGGLRVEVQQAGHLLVRQPLERSQEQDLLIRLGQLGHRLVDAVNQLALRREDVKVTARDLLTVPEGAISEEGVRGCIRVGVQYLESWLRGNGCVPLYHLMEDAATAEICRAQLWQWLHHGARTSDGAPVSVERFDRLLTEELSRIHEEVGAARLTGGVFPSAARLFEQMTKSESFDEFLTLPAYELLS